jgi:predicted nucleic acid-binding Zn ribbon protein
MVERSGEPVRIGDLIPQLMARRGYAQILASEAFRAAWSQVAGPLADHSQPGGIRRGTLEVIARNSSIVQELTFQKKQLLQDLRLQMPKLPIRAIRFRVGEIG